MCSMVAKSINARKEVRTNVVGLNKVSKYVLKHGVRKEQCVSGISCGYKEQSSLKERGI